MASTSNKKHIVLYVDDDEDDLQLIDEGFSKFSSVIQLETATDGVEAIDSLTKMAGCGTTPCLIVLDINMPRLDGRETLVRIKQMEAFENVPVILFSTSERPLDIAFAQQHNAAYITKPAEFSQLETIIEQLVDHCSNDIKKMLGIND